MNYVLLVFLILSIIGIKYRDKKDDYLSKEQTTVIKGIFALIILLSHFSSLASPVNSSWYFRFISLFGQLMVTIFLFYSGYGIMKSINTKDNYMNTFIKNRFLKTLLNFDYAIILYIIVNLLLNIKYPLATNLLAFTAYANIGNSNWFIFIILALYLITYISYKLLKNNKLAMIIEVFVLSLILIVILYFLKESWWYNTILCFPLGLLYGYLEKDINEKILKKHNMLSFIALSIVFVILYRFRFNLVCFLILSCIFTLLVINITYIFRIGNKVLSFLGRYAFYIYIYQRIAFIIFKNAIDNDILLFTISLTFTIILSLLCKKTNDVFNGYLFDNKKETVNDKSLFHKLYLFLRFRNYIIFESNPDYADNTYYVYKELLNQGYNKKYKLIWLVKDPNKFKDINIKNVLFIKRENNDEEVKKYVRNAKFIIDCNRYINKENKYQFRFHLGHGMPIKVVPDYTSAVGEYDKFLLSSTYFIDYFKKYGNIEESKMEFLGLPRCDQFSEKKEYFKEIEGYDKVILWMPTFRNHQSKDYNKKLKLKFGVPSIDDEKQLIELNNILKEKNSLLLIKFHPAENMDFLKTLDLTNILFTKNEFFENNHKNIYHLAQNTDALITDYSSIYYDYMMLDKPIGMAIEDIDEYRKFFPVYFDDIESALPAEYIYGYDDLLKFIKNVLANKDITRTRRNNKRKLYFKYIDGNTSKRIVEVLKRNSL